MNRLELRGSLDDPENRDEDPVVLLAAQFIGFELADIQPCLYNPTTGDTLPIDDVDVGPGYVRAVALIPK